MIVVLKQLLFLSFCSLFFSALILATETSEYVPRPAPLFDGGSNFGYKRCLSSFIGKPVILIIDKCPTPFFKKQLHEIDSIYRYLSAEGVVCFVALTENRTIIPSTIPYIFVDNPQIVAKNYHSDNHFSVVMIGIDGNIDCISEKPLPAYRLHDIIINNAGMQQRVHDTE